MNDTFDDFTFADLEENPKSTPKNISDKNERNAKISFDDSLFLNNSFQTPKEADQENLLKTQRDNKSLDSIFSQSLILDESYKTELILSPKVQEISKEIIEKLELVESSFNVEESLKTDSLLSPERKLIESDLSFEKLSIPSSPQESKDICVSPTVDIKTNLSQKLEALSVTDTNLIHLSEWGLPAAILQKYQSRNITKMFPWQVECLNNPKILQQNSNLVYSAPTSAGKTLVAEILTIKTVVEREKKVIFILPYVSVVREKMFYFQDILGSSGVRVEGFMGSYNPPGGFSSVKVAICTIEKANSLVNKLLQEKQLHEVGAIIIDEMHLLGDPSRGYLLELLLTKIKYITQVERNLKIQIVGMSATLPNLNTLAKWLEAQLYITSFRPIPLYERAIICGEIFSENMEKIRALTPLPDLGTDVDNVLQLCLETIMESCSVLIFCPTKVWCENLALQIAQAFRRIGSLKTDLGEKLRAQIHAQAIMELFEQLKACPVGLDQVLQRTAAFGVAFHHAGLTIDERDIIEGAFRSGTLRVLVATSTLSSGVNLPAKRVIIRTPIFHGKPLDELVYKQMIGRAGRMGRDSSGESILICQKTEATIARNLMCSKLQPIESCLVFGGRLKRAILEIVASGVASTPDDVELFAKCTLLSNQEVTTNDVEDSTADEKSPIEVSLDFLVKHEFLRLQHVDNGVRYVATAFGKACLSSSIPPEDGLALFTELEKARKCLVLDTELHLIYLVTPYSACQQWNNLDWMMYLNFWERLPATMKKVGELVGIKESYLIGATRGKIQTNTSQAYHRFLVHKRFFVALALQDLVNEKPLCEVCEKFACNRGMLQSLQQSAATFAGMVTTFSKQLGWANIEILIGQFQNRLHFGIGRDLLDLMRLPFLNGKSARLLYNAGFESLVQLANSNVETIENVLHKVVPFESGTKRDGESESDLKERTKFKTIWITGKEGVTEKEAAELLLKGARNYLQLEMGLEEAKWSREEQEQHDSAIGQPSVSRLSTSDLFEGSFVKEKTPTKEESIIENSPSNNETRNTSSDFIETSQEEFSPMPCSKKRMRLSDLSRFQSPRKKHKLFTKCSIDKVETIDVCMRDELYESFSKELEEKREISLSIAWKHCEERKILIGIQNIPPDAKKYSYKSKEVEGLAISWDESTIFYLDLKRKETVTNLVKHLAENDKVTIRLYDAKNQLKLLKQCCGIDFRCKIQDPKIADWILEPDGKEKDLQALILCYCPEIATLYRVYSTSDSSKKSSCTKALITWYLCEAVRRKLLEVDGNLLDVYDVETNCLKILAQMEVNGIGINPRILMEITDTLSKVKTALESKAYALAGRRFSMSSSKEVRNILHLSEKGTKKSILERCTNPLSDLIVQWRKINTIIIKNIQPLVCSVENNRIYGTYITHTATGRISMYEPNLQSVAKDFQVDFNQKSVTISCRNAFAPRHGHLLVSADYCQLELRLLSHLSQDGKLCTIMRQKSGDIFKSIAAQWNRIREDEVTDSLRQRCKQISYGIIYGMGAKTLGEQLGVDENEAEVFMDTFQNAYPGLKSYTKKITEICTQNGYVQTITGRKRFLPNITSNSVGLRRQAERQAVNTTIQGSAADLVKNAMIKLEERLRNLEENPLLVLHLHDELLYEVRRDFVTKFVVLLKSTMEDSVRLSIPFPVKIKTGPSWGQLEEFL